MPTLRQWLRDEALKITGGYVGGGSPADVARLTFISDEDAIREAKLREYDVWYKGDGDELLNLYHKDNTIDYSLEPWFWKNKRSYYWTVSSTEDDVKRTHSGMPQNIISTLVGIIGTPTFTIYNKDERPMEATDKKSPQTETMEDIMRAMDFWTQYKEIQMTMTLVEGWGCWKTEWDMDYGEHPTERYYRAQDVDFVWKGGKVVAIIFRDWYQGHDEGERYLVTEIRKLVPRKKDGKILRDLMIEIRSWKVAGGDTTADTCITPVDLNEIPEMRGCNQKLVMNNVNSLYARPCIFYKDATDDKMPGRSIFQNKIDLFDDLDQALSQEANTIGKSTPEELFNTDFLDRDPHTKMPVMPNRYDRKYTTFVGGRDAAGATNTNQPVQVTQPQLNCAMYSQAITDTMSQILSGIMSPATMGINVSVQATAESQREKEKVTKFTTDHIKDAEREILIGVMTDLLQIEEYLKTGKITVKDYDIAIKFTAFATASVEEKAATWFQIFDAGDISPETYYDMVYGDTQSAKEKERELSFLIQKVQKKAQQEREQAEQQAMMRQQMAMQAQQPQMQTETPMEQPMPDDAQMPNM